MLLVFFKYSCLLPFQSLNRQACADAGVHGVIRQGIHMSKDGAYSVCLSGKYEDDNDNGDTLCVAPCCLSCAPSGLLMALIRHFPSVYTGTGGKEDASSVSHQDYPFEMMLTRPVF